MKVWIIAAALGIALSAAGTSGAFAQAGSAGGTIGKSDKSISGGREEHQRSRGQRREQVPAPHHASRAEPNNAGCQRVVGTWNWFLGGDTVFYGDRTGRSASGPTFTWTCSGDSYVLTWSHGFVDHLRISPDGKRLDGSNGISSVSGTRK